MSVRERANESQHHTVARRLRIAAWIVYLIGLPFIVVMLAMKHDWIAASVEASGAPSMLLGLVIAFRKSNAEIPRWLDRLAIVCIPLGFIYSIYDFGGLNQMSQILEIGLIAGFLVGTYLLARDRMSGYLWYVLMHVSCGWLVWIQGMQWFTLQQAISLAFIGDAFWTRLRHRKATSS